MKRVLTLTTAIVSLAIASQAMAADMPPRQPMPPQGAVKAPPPIFNWSGFYVGAHGGYGWGSSQFSAPVAGTAGSFDTDGWVFGGLLGVNYQVGQTVFGLETDINWSDFAGSAACGLATCETDVPWFGTLRGRLGYAADRFMPYVTGGLAYGKVKANVPGFGGDSDTRLGWTVGVGAEYAFTENMSWKTEYLYMDLGSFDCTACGLPVPDVDFKSHIVRTGVNVRF